MSNGARHGLGIVAGIVLTPVMVAGLMYGIQQLGLRTSLLRLELGEVLPAYALLTFIAVLLGLLVGSRISPLASLIPGIAYTAVGALWVFAPRWAFQNTGDVLPDDLRRGYGYLGPYGILLVIGVLLLVASLPPSRWRIRTASATAQGRPGAGALPQGPYGAQGPQAGLAPGFGAPPAPYGGHHPQQPVFGGPPAFPQAQQQGPAQQQGQVHQQSGPPGSPAPGFGPRPGFGEGPGQSQDQPPSFPQPQPQPQPQPSSPAAQPYAYGQGPSSDRPPAFPAPDEASGASGRTPPDRTPSGPGGSAGSSGSSDSSGSSGPPDGAEDEPGSWTRIYGGGSDSGQGSRPGDEPPAPR